MSSSPNTFSSEVCGTRICDPSVDLKVKLVILGEIRDSIEIVHSHEYSSFLANILPPFMSILSDDSSDVERSYIDNDVHRLRNIILEVIHRFPYNEALKVYAPDLMSCLMNLLNIDNEDNAVIALKIIVDLHKNYTSIMDPYVQEFLDLVKEIYENMPTAVTNAFAEDAIIVDSSSPRQDVALAKFSFKVLTECPIIIALLFQLYRVFVTSNVPIFVEPIMTVLMLQPAQQQQAHDEAAQRGTYHLGMASTITNPSVYAEYKSLQVKTVSFLAYILRSFLPMLQPFKDTIADGVITLMKDLPGDASATRKELLVAARHLWFTDFRMSFLRHIDVLLNDDVLVGTGVTCQETLRPLAHSVLIDLLHNVRIQLQPLQISRIISSYSRNLQDVNIPPQIQTMCVKLLLGLADNLVQQKEKGEARQLLIQIMDSFAARLTALRDMFPTVLKYHQRKKAMLEKGNGADENFQDLQEIEGFIDIGVVQPIRTAVKSFENSPEIVKDMRFQFKSVLIGVKSCVNALQTIDSAARPSTFLTLGIESEILKRVFLHGLDCFEYYFVDSDKEKISVQKDDKDIVEAFASIFTVVDPALFQEVCSENIEFLFERALQNPFLISVPQFFLSNRSTSGNFSGPLLAFLMARFEEAGKKDSTKSTIILRLFKLLFLSLSAFPEQNERVFQPHLANLIMSSLKVSANAEEPMNYFLLLRGLFRGIGGGKFEALYQEVIPLLQVLLETLNSLLFSAYKSQMRELFVELALTVPVRLSVLLPHLSYLMRPLVIALHAGPDLVNQSLKTLELCIDNLNHEFLEPIFAPVKEDLMSALWKHLHPVPYNQNHSHTTMRILGKFGGRNRRILRDQSTLALNSNQDENIQLSFFMHGSNRLHNLPLGKALLCAKNILLSSSSSKTQYEQAFLFSKSCAPLFFDADFDSDTFEETVASLLDAYKKKHAEPCDSHEVGASPFNADPDLHKHRREAIDEALRDWVNNLIIGASLPDIEEIAWPFVQDLCRHFALLDIDECANAPPAEVKAQKMANDALVAFATSRLNGFLRALVDCSSSESRSVRDVTERAVIFLKECYFELLGSAELVKHAAAFQVLPLWYSSHCYQPEWYRKQGGCTGIAILSTKLGLGSEWMLEHEIEFVKALLYLLKDVSVEAASIANPTASDTLFHVLKVCNEGGDNENAMYSSKFTSLVTVLITELSNPSQAVRETVQKAFKNLSEFTGKPITEILLPVRDRLIFPIFAKPLRALPFALQIGYIDAISYGLSLSPPLLVFTDELGRLLHEALALADSEDQALSNKDNQYKNASAMNKLRVECIKLLSAVMTSPEISSSRLSSVRQRIITLFFKCLYSKSPEVIKVANIGLTDVLGHSQRLPKDLLQAGLKPILVNISNHEKLTVAGLQGLARLLELLTNYFKVEIGKKLIDHLDKWADPLKTEEWSARPLAEINEVNILAALLDVFHLLPHGAEMYLEELVQHTIHLESLIRRSDSSPFRNPIGRFLARYASQSVAYFLERLGKAEFSNLFISLLKCDVSGPTLAELISDPARIEASVFQSADPEEKTQVLRNGISMIQAISDLRPEWLHTNRFLLDRCILIWKERPRGIFIDQFYRSRQNGAILNMMISYCLKNSDEIDMVFDIIDAFLDSEITDTNSLKQFVYSLSSNRTPESKKIIVIQFLDLFSQTTISMRQKTNLIRHLIVPLLMLLKEEVSIVVDQDCILKILQYIWSPNLVGDSQADVEALKMELLQLTTLVLYQVPELVGEYLKEVIKFAWAHLKIEDMTIKQSAYVLLCRFIKEYETPTKIVTQTYVAQLRAHQIEIRPMVKQALDNMIPVLPFRNGMNEPDKANIPLWVQWIRKIIIEDGHSVSQLVSIYQLLIRNSENFYPCREHFMSQIVSSLARLGLSGNSTAETKTLSIELTSLISKWECKYQEKQKVGAMDVDGADPSSAFTSSLNQQEVIITFLIRFCLHLSVNDATLHKALITKALETLESFILIWPDAPISMTPFEKVSVMEIGDQTVHYILNAAEILKVMVRSKSLLWVQSNVAIIQKNLEKWATFNPSVFVNNMASTTGSPLLLSCFSEIIPRTIAALDFNDVNQSPRRTLEKQSLLKSIDSRIHEKLKSESNIDLVTCFLKVAYLEAPSSSPSSLRPHIPELVKLLQKLVTSTKEWNLNETVENITIIIQTLNSQILYLGELRKTFLSSIGSIAEQKDASALHRVALDTLKKWVLDPVNEGFPTMKEKANLALKMAVLKNHPDPSLYEEYMNFVVDVYEASHLNCTEITVRLEEVFLEGTKLANRKLRARFLKLFDDSIPVTMSARLSYILSQQNWQGLADSFWIRLALDLLLGSIVSNHRIYDSNADTRFSFLNTDSIQTKKKKNSGLKAYLAKQSEFLTGVKVSSVSSIIIPLRSFIHEDDQLAYGLWLKVFPICWTSIESSERQGVVKSLITLLAKDYHLAQATFRPNVIQATLDAVCRSEPCIQLPPQLVKYLGKTFGCWHISLELLQNSVLDLNLSTLGISKEDDKVRDSFMDALGDLYTDLGEDDYFAGLWRRRCLFSETNAAISFEQCGMWQAAQKYYEGAQSKARSCALPFTESEYYLWEKQWIASTQRLQQWDILTDLSKHDSNPDLLLECAWRLSDWNVDHDALNMTLQSVSQPLTTRKKFFQAVLVLNRISEGQEPTVEFHKICEEGMQLVLKQWHGLPTIISNAHIPTFHTFQMFVELQEAFTIQSNLIGTTAMNIENKSQELKNILSTWRDRLPNTWDDINIWSDLVAWRQHVFTAINKAYLPLVPHIIAPNVNSASSSYAYRGYHETAWIINRFAHVARKQLLAEVCISSLSKIYTLPNIEIQEAFFKLREQAKCHKEVLHEYAAGLDVINNTNLVFFSQSQKADFFTLRGSFFAKLNLHEEAAAAFASALQVETNLGHGWTEFGEYNDRMFDERPTEIKFAADAVNCYLQASGIFNSGRCRKYLSRILWLLSLDDEQGSVMAAADAYKPDFPVWYWITFIPELIGSLAGKEAKFGRNILIKIAKTYPQALHFQLRTTKEDFAAMKRVSQMQPQSSTSQSGPPPPVIVEPSSPGKDKDENGDVDMHAENDSSAQPAESSERTKEDSGSATTNQPLLPPTPWDHIDEVMGILKTAYPLLALTMETMVDQILARLKPTTDEDIYRLIVALLNDGVQMFLTHLSKHPDSGGPLSQATETSLNRFSDSMVPNHIKYKEAFEKDFITSKPNLSQLVDRFRVWRDKLEILLDSRPQKHNLEHFTQYLAEFEHSKFDDIEVPGQYFQMKSSSKDFARIERFDPIAYVVRAHAGCHRRIMIKGHDGSDHSFIIQHPAAKQYRREERTVQLFRLLNETLERRVETRRKNLHFNLPVIIPLAPQIRLVQDDRTNINLQDIFEDHARNNGFGKDDPSIYYIDRMKEACMSQDLTKKSKVDIIGLKAEINQEISEKMIPDTIVSKYFWNRMASIQDLWTLRKRFTTQMASVTVMTYLLSIGNRLPQKFYVSCKKGNIWLPELFATISPQTFLITNTEAIPFRLTPNLQHFMTPIGIEGLFSSSIVTLATALSNEDSELKDYLSIFIRDELIAWQNVVRKPVVGSTARLRELVGQNLRLVISRAEVLSCKNERDSSQELRSEPLNQMILDLISQATNPLKLAQMELAYMSQL